MIINHLKIAWRNIWKNKVFSMINILGLSIGLSTAFAIGAIIYFDMTFDKFHLDGDRIYRLTTNFIEPEGKFYNRGVPVPLGKYAKEQMTGFETVSTFFTKYFISVENKEKDLKFRNVNDAIITDSNYFNLFNYQWLVGSAKELAEPNNVVLTKSRAAKYFPKIPSQQIIGKTLWYNDSLPIRVCGIVADFNNRTDLFFKEFVSKKTAQNNDMSSEVYSDNWFSTNSATQVFVKIQTNTKLDNIQKQLDAITAEHADKKLLDLGHQRSYYLQSLADIHFNANYGIFNNSSHQGSKQVLVSLALVALFLLVLGCINFINLNTAQATKRAKEIGIRKTLGSSKRQLIFQFLGETFILTLCATFLSVFITSWLLQTFSDFMPDGIQFNILGNPLLLVSIVLLLLIVTFLSGFYPALVLSNYKPISVLKNQIVSGADKSSLRKYLTVFQFVIAQVFIIATLIVGKQLNFMMTKDMGFKTHAKAYIRAWQSDGLSKRLNFAEEISKIPEVSMISLGDNPPASNSTSSTIVTFITDDKEINTNLELLVGDVNYLKVYGIELLAGRNRLNDTIKEYVINETYSKILGFKQPAEAIGHYIKINDDKVPIVGVMKDFNQHSLHSEIKPMALGGDIYRNTYPSQFTTIHFTLQKQALKHLTDVIAKVKSDWKSVYPDDDFEINFMDDTIKEFYNQEQKTAVLLKWATSLAIVISCLGLLGFVIHTTERRVKEIGVRKVLGASTLQINLLLCKEFLVLIAIAFLISIPIAWWSMNNWLQDFVYKTSLSWWIFLVSGIGMMLLAFLIISIRTIAAANVNPVKSLRSE